MKAKVLIDNKSVSIMQSLNLLCKNNLTIKGDHFFYKLLLGDQYDIYVTDNSNTEIFENPEFDWLINKEKLSSIFNSITPNLAYEIDKTLIDRERNADFKRIDKRYVHKKNEKNVLLSSPIKYGNINYFYLFLDNEEFYFDHESDHVQGMLLMEAARQAGIVTVHLNGLDLQGKMNLTKMHTDFYNYVEIDEPISIRSISNPVIFKEGKNNINIFCMVNIIQFGRICTTTTFSSIAFKNHSHIEDFRNKSIRINLKNKDKYNNLFT